MNLADGFEVVAKAAVEAARPDPELRLDEWSEQHMMLPKGSANPGPYRIERTPMARRILQVLSPGHPCKRVVVRGASQMLKTQIAINAIGGWIHRAPGNILVLEPTDKLAKRLSARVTKAVAQVPVLRERVASPRSRDARNTIDTKEFDGGALHIVTAGAAANLAEIPAPYVIFDEVDRMESNVDGEGDPISLGEARATTFEGKSKFYAVSSPTRKDSSKIDQLFAMGTQEEYLVPCPHCGHHHPLVVDNFRYSRNSSSGIMERAWFVCPECGAEIEERDKTQMLRDEGCGGTAHWKARSQGDGETISFQVSAFYAPIGSITWLTLARQHAMAEERRKQGDDQAAIVFHNTRLALSWDRITDRTTAEALKAMAAAAPFPLRRVPRPALVLTAGIDMQDNRIEVVVWGYGRGGHMWTIDYRVFWGNPGEARIWNDLDVYLSTRFPHEGGQRLGIEVTGIDSQGHFTHRVYGYCMYREQRRIYALRGDPKPGKAIVAGRPSSQTVNANGSIVRDGVKLWHVGTDTAKDLFFNRIKLGLVHISPELPDEFFEHLTNQICVPQRTARGEERRYVPVRNGARDEGLDCTVYSLWGAARMKLDDYTDAEWDHLDTAVCPPSADLFAGEPEPPLPAPADTRPGSVRDEPAEIMETMALASQAAVHAHAQPAAAGRRVFGGVA